MARATMSLERRTQSLAERTIDQGQEKHHQEGSDSTKVLLQVTLDICEAHWLVGDAEFIDMVEQLCKRVLTRLPLLHGVGPVVLEFPIAPEMGRQ